MYVKRKVNDCDFTGERFEEPQDGFAVIARGATGRWCEVMWGGEATLRQLEADGAEFLTYGEAHEAVEAMGHPNRADF